MNVCLFSFSHCLLPSTSIVAMDVCRKCSLEKHWRKPGLSVTWACFCNGRENEWCLVTGMLGWHDQTTWWSFALLLGASLHLNPQPSILSILRFGFVSQREFMPIIYPSSLGPEFCLSVSRIHSYCKGHGCFTTLPALKLCYQICHLETFSPKFYYV